MPRCDVTHSYSFLILDSFFDKSLLRSTPESRVIWFSSAKSIICYVKRCRLFVRKWSLGYECYRAYRAQIVAFFLFYLDKYLNIRSCIHILYLLGICNAGMHYFLIFTDIYKKIKNENLKTYFNSKFK